RRAWRRRATPTPGRWPTTARPRAARSTAGSRWRSCPESGPFAGGQLVARVAQPAAVAPRVFLEGGEVAEADLLDDPLRGLVSVDVADEDLVQAERLETPARGGGGGFGHQPSSPERRRDPVAQLGAVDAPGAKLPAEVVQPDAPPGAPLVLDGPDDVGPLGQRACGLGVELPRLGDVAVRRPGEHARHLRIRHERPQLVRVARLDGPQPQARRVDDERQRAELGNFLARR